MPVMVTRLINGDDVIGETDGVGLDHYRIKNPVRLQMIQQSPNSQPQVAMVPWCELTADKEVIIRKDLVVTQMKPLKAIEDQHKKAFGGILTPTSGLVGL